MEKIKKIKQILKQKVKFMEQIIHHTTFALHAIKATLHYT